MTERFDYSNDITDAATMRKQRQLRGVEFGDVMCSATESDQNGLNAVYTQFALSQMMGQVFEPVYFHFENGSKLLLTAGSIAAFKEVWLPFRRSFFPVPTTDTE